MGVNLVGGLTRAHNRITGEHLIGTPPDYLRAEWVGRFPEIGVLGSSELALTSLFVAQQVRTDPRADFVAPPEGYFLLGVSAQTELRWGPRLVRLGLGVDNLLNTRYRDYTSLLRYYADQPGLSARFRASTTF